MYDHGQGPSQHSTPRMHQRPNDPAIELLKDDFVTTPRVMRIGCYICEDMEFARMGMSLCSPCCVCSQKASTTAGHIAADDGACDDCGHDACDKCMQVPGEEDICSCDKPCCEADVGVGTVTCGSQHCPTHGVQR